MSTHVPIQMGGKFQVAVVESTNDTPSRWQVAYTEPGGRSIRFGLRGPTDPLEYVMVVNAEREGRQLFIGYAMGAGGRSTCEYVIAPSQGKFAARKMK
jgi:hypothetical protein